MSILSKLAISICAGVFLTIVGLVAYGEEPANNIACKKAAVAEHLVREGATLDDVTGAVERDPTDPTAEMVEEMFGSFDAFIEEFKAAQTREVPIGCPETD